MGNQQKESRGGLRRSFGKKRGGEQGAQRQGDGHCSLVEPKGGKGRWWWWWWGNRAEDVKLGTGLFNGAMAALYKRLRALSQRHRVAPALGKLVRLRQCLK